MTPKAVHFDGSTYLQNDGVPVMPPSSRYGLLSFWYNADRQSQPVISTRDDNGEPSIWVTLDDQLHLTLEAWSGSVPTHVMERLGIADLPHDSAWHHVLLTWDTQ